MTASDRRGHSFVESDRELDSSLDLGQISLTDLWELTNVPSQIDAGSPTDDQGRLSLEPTLGGVKFRVVEYAREDLDADVSSDDFAAMGAAHAHVEDSLHPAMHQTETVDFGIVLHGRITMVLDDEEVELEAGDVVIQRGTNHAWSNRSDQNALVAFILVSGARRVTD